MRSGDPLMDGPRNPHDILAVLGHDIDAPWHTLPQEARDWILFTDEQPVVTVHAEREAHRIQRPYQGTYMSARRYVLKALTMSQSAQQRKRALQFVETVACPACGGASRVPSDALGQMVGCPRCQAPFVAAADAPVGPLPSRSAAAPERAGAPVGAAPVASGRCTRAEVT